MRAMIGQGDSEMMLFTCDWCGEEARGIKHREHWDVPPGWYSCGDSANDDVACSKSCLDNLSKSGELCPCF